MTKRAPAPLDYNDCPPGESLTAWIKRQGKSKSHRVRSYSAEQLHDLAIRELTKLLPKAVEQAQNGKPALLRMILRACK